MGNPLEKSISYIKENYPELSISVFENHVVFEGRFIISATYKEHDISIAPRLRILFPKSYPFDSPIIFDVLNAYPSDHRLENKGLCVATPFDLLIELSTSETIEEYINKFLIPYFISIVVFNRTGEYVYGDRSHGVDGFYSSIADYFQVDSQDRDLILNLIGWASKKIRLSRIQNIDNSLYQRKFSRKIGVLRVAGVIGLKRIYNHLSKMDEMEKMYFTYLNNIAQKETA